MLKIKKSFALRRLNGGDCHQPRNRVKRAIFCLQLILELTSSRQWKTNDYQLAIRALTLTSAPRGADWRLVSMLFDHLPELVRGGHA